MWCELNYVFEKLHTYQKKKQHQNVNGELIIIFMFCCIFQISYINYITFIIQNK